MTSMPEADSRAKNLTDKYFAIDLSKHISGIVHIKLKENHRSGLVGDILDYIYGR